MAKWDYDEMYNVATQLSGAVAAKLRSEENQTIGQLFKFIEEWCHNYRLVCEEFDLYHKVPVSGYVPVGCYYGGEAYMNCLYNTDFFSVNFFEKILQKTCIFEKIVSPVDNFNYNYAAVFYGQGSTMQQPPSKLCIMSERFTLSCEANHKDKVWTLDTRMANNQSPQQGLVLSLIQTLMGNYVPLSLYKRNKHFRNFIDKLSEVTQFDFRFEGPDKLLVTSEGELRSNPDCTTFKYKEGSKECVRIDHCRFGSNNLMFSYKHLDELFGKNRKEMLTEGDLQLYSICNEGRKPFIYDWEFTV
jgi:hypothetical protein